MASLVGAAEATGADGHRRSAFATAYLNGSAANALDFDDTLYGHPGAPVISAALAVGEREGCRLADLLRSVVMGYQVHWLLARAALPTPLRARRVRGVGVFDALAAAAACVAIRAVDIDRLAAALALAGTHSCVPYVAKWYERPMPTVKNNLGWSAAAGVLACDLADAGAVGLPDVLDGPAGFWAMAGSDSWRWAETRQEDTIPAVLRVGFKRYPACWHVQQYLHVLDQLISDPGPAADVVAIDITGPEDLQKFAEDSLAGPADIAFSIRTLCALVATRVAPGAQWVDDQTVRAVEPIWSRASVRYGRRRTVTVQFDDGRKLHSAVPKGDFSNPYTDGLPEERVAEKFDVVVGKAIGRPAADLLQKSILHGSGDLPVQELTVGFAR
jgi:2-methylcitrate dehydratase PrpD